MTDASDTPYGADLDAEERGWYDVVTLVRRCEPAEHLIPGYYRDPDWSLRDLVGHLGTWLAEAATQFERMLAGTYEGHDIDIDELNAVFLAALRDQPWDVCWTQANAGRTRMRQAWMLLPEPTVEASWWIRKSAVDHYAEHRDRLAEWVDELVSRRRG
ncbi:MAG: hypothetical protein ACJ779_06190 [Chloroflexota bacterium]